MFSYKYRNHPYLMGRQDSLLWSINERLGALAPRIREVGLNLDPPNDDWLDDMLETLLLEAKEVGKNNGRDDLKSEDDGDTISPDSA